VIGACVAYWLAEKGADVILLDKGGPGDGVSAASYGWVNANEKEPRAYFALSRAAMEEYRRFAWRLAPAPWYHADGNLIWFSDPDLLAELQARVRRLQGWGYEAEMLPARVVLAKLEPELAISDPEAPVAWFAQEAWVDALAMTRRLVEAIRNAGRHVLTGPEREVVAIGRDGERVISVTLRGGQTIPVDIVVNAAGAGAPHVAAMVGRQIPLTIQNGLAIRLELPDGDSPLHRTVETDAVSMRPDGPGRVFLSPDDDPRLREMPAGPLPLDDPLVTQAMADAARAVPALAGARPVEALIGARPIPPDWLPIVGPVAGMAGYWEAVTHSGVTLAPFLGRVLASELMGGPRAALLESFRPQRFART
jgi:glycine/D-amino acid oxidase-like deaminating enzyme